MAVRTRLVTLLGPWLVLVGSSTACRGVDICGAEGCQTARSQTEPTEGGDGGAGTSTQAGTGGAEGGASEPDLGGAGQAGESQTPPGEMCAPDLADCDGSSLTPCETNLTWSVRHCGDCGQVCDGLCQRGRCEAAELIWEGYVSSMISSASIAFAVVDSGEHYVLLKVDVHTGTTSLLLGKISYYATLAVSSDRFYALDTDEGLLHSASLDGTDSKVEIASSRLQTLGATDDGAYYVDYAYDEEAEESTDQLWFRAVGASGWELLRAAPGLTIISSSPFGLLLEELDAEGKSKLFVVHTKTIEELTGAPAEPVTGAITNSGPVLLTRDSTTNVAVLWWETPSQTAQYEIPASAYERLHVLNDRVALYFQDNGNAFVQHFTPDGPVLGKGGLHSIGDVVWVDDKYTWYTIWDNAAARRFLRSEWRDFDF